MVRFTVQLKNAMVTRANAIATLNQLRSWEDLGPLCEEWVVIVPPDEGVIHLVANAYIDTTVKKKKKAEPIDLFSGAGL